jgi:hypothetical protein
MFIAKRRRKKAWALQPPALQLVAVFVGMDLGVARGGKSIYKNLLQY